jgi:hypothetical protein
VGSTGASTGPHLHLERLNSQISGNTNNSAPTTTTAPTASNTAGIPGFNQEIVFNVGKTQASKKEEPKDLISSMTEELMRNLLSQAGIEKNLYNLDAFNV